nr:MAG TPA: hypothetical protein [Caudoviricetes sp.]
MPIYFTRFAACCQAFLQIFSGWWEKPPSPTTFFCSACRKLFTETPFCCIIKSSKESPLWM